MRLDEVLKEPFQEEPKSYRLSDVNRIYDYEIPPEPLAKDKGIGGNLVEGVVQAFSSAPQVAGKLTMAFGDYVRSEKHETIFGTKPVFDVRPLAGRVYDLGKKITESNEKYIQRTFPEQENVTFADKFAKGVGQGSVSLVSALGMGLLLGPGAPAVAFGVGATAEGFNEARKKDKDLDEAIKIGGILGLAEGGLEFWGVKRLMGLKGGKIKKLIENGVNGAFTEFTQEFAQTGASESIRTAFGLEEYKGLESVKRIASDALFSGAIGAVLGSSAGASMTLVQRKAVEDGLVATGMDKENSVKKADELMKGTIDNVVTEIESIQESKNEETTETTETTKEEETLLEEAKKYKTAEEFVKSHTKVERYGKGSESIGVSGRGGESVFFSPEGEGITEFGDTKTEAIIEKDTKIFEGYSSVDYAMENNLMNRKYSLVKELTGLDTLKEVLDASGLGVTSSSGANEAYQRNPNIFYTAFQQVVAKELKKKGFDGALWSQEDELLPTQYQIWNKSKIKTKQQLTQIWEQANNTNGEKEKTPSGLASSIKKSAVKEGLKEDFGELPSYETRDMDDIAGQVSEFITNDYDLAKKIALGEAPEQGGLRAQELFTGLRVKATAEGDIDTLRDLALSDKASAMATELGQRIKALDTGEPGDPVKVMRDIKKVRQEAYEKKSGKKKISKQKKEDIKGMKEHIKKAVKKQDWEGFIKSLEC